MLVPMNSSIPSLSILAGAAFFAGAADAANVITNSSFNNDSGTPITGSNGTRTISGWGSIHLYNHTYNGTDGPKLGGITNIPAYGVNDDITIAEASGLNGTYKGLAAPSQTVNLSSVLDAGTLTAIAAGNGTFSFSSWMSGYKSDNNVVATRVRFFSGSNASGITVGTFTLDRGVTTNQVTTADILVNPGGVNNTIIHTKKRGELTACCAHEEGARAGRRGRAAEKRRSENVCESSSRKKHTTQDDEGVLKTNE
jgi:hypothetical protein